MMISQIKFLMTKKGIAMVEMKNSRGADNVLNHLNRIKVLGSQMSVGVFLKICNFHYLYLQFFHVLFV